MKWHKLIDGLLDKITDDELVVKLERKKFIWNASKNRYVKLIKIGTEYNVEYIHYINGISYYKLKNIEGVIYDTRAFSIIKDERVIKWSILTIETNTIELNLETTKPENKSDK